MLTSLRTKRDTKEIDRLSYHKIGDPATPIPRTCKKCKVKTSEKGTCACDVKNHPDLKNYRIDENTVVRYESEDSANSELNRIFEPPRTLLELTNRAASMLDNTMHIDAGNNKSAEQKNGDQSEGESRTNQPQNSPPHRPTSPAHSERDSPITMPQEDRNQREDNADTQLESPGQKAIHDASNRAAPEKEPKPRDTPPHEHQQSARREDALSLQHHRRIPDERKVSAWQHSTKNPQPVDRSWTFHHINIEILEFQLSATARSTVRQPNQTASTAPWPRWKRCPVKLQNTRTPNIIEQHHQSFFVLSEGPTQPTPSESYYSGLGSRVTPGPTARSVEATSEPRHHT